MLFCLERAIAVEQSGFFIPTVWVHTWRVDCIKKHRHNSVTGRLVLYRLWIEIIEKMGTEDRRGRGRFTTPPPSSASLFLVRSTFDFIWFYFLFLWGSGGWDGRIGSRSKHSFLVQRGGVEGEKEERGDREGRDEFGGDGVRSKWCFDNLIVSLFFHPACRDVERKEGNKEGDRRFGLVTDIRDTFYLES